MKKKLLATLFVVAAAIAGVFAFGGCNGGGGENDSGNYHSHNFVDEKCEICGKDYIPTEGLKYSLNEEETEYTVRGIDTTVTSDISDIIIPNMHENKPVTSIGGDAFVGCSGLTCITIPDSVTSIGWQAFFGCSGLTSITIPDSVTSIGNSAFYNCSGLTSVTIGNSVTSIGSGAFSDCSGLTSITIPDSVTSIGACAFYGCSGLTSVTIPDSVTSIGGGAFSVCTKLIQTENGVKYVDKWIIDCDTSATAVTLRSDTKGISDDAFYGCSGLTSITIPDSVTSIGGGAFFGCSGLTIYCEAAEQPNGWSSWWQSGCSAQVVWGYNG